METSKWYVYDAEIIAMLSEFSDVVIAQKCLNTTEAAGKNKDVNTLRNYVGRVRRRQSVKHTETFKEFSTESKTDSNNYNPPGSGTKNIVGFKPIGLKIGNLHLNFLRP